jgi:hypothetical protein
MLELAEMKMNTLLKCLILATCAVPAFAQESSNLKMKAKLIVQSGTVAPWRASEAPIASAPKPAPLFPPVATKRERIPGSCEVSGNALCYDYRHGGSVFKPSRELMPEISGMQRESIGVRRDKITFKYSFK